jgi:hypothetical protein
MLFVVPFAADFEAIGANEINFLEGKQCVFQVHSVFGPMRA